MNNLKYWVLELLGLGVVIATAAAWFTLMFMAIAP